MALIKCTECGKEISDSAVSCPNCGCKTSHGQTEAQAKGLLVGWIIGVAGLVIGLILFFTGHSALQEYKDSFLGSHNWETGRWVEDSEAVGAFMKKVIGIGMSIGGLVSMFIMNAKAKELPNQPVKTISTTEGYTSSSQSNAPRFNANAIPTWKRIQMEEEQAKNQDQTD